MTNDGQKGMLSFWRSKLKSRFPEVVPRMSPVESRIPQSTYVVPQFKVRDPQSEYRYLQVFSHNPQTASLRPQLESCVPNIGFRVWDRQICWDTEVKDPPFFSYLPYLLYSVKRGRCVV